METKKSKNEGVGLVKLSRTDKILLAMYSLANGKKKQLKFEDIVVKLFQKYGDDFHLRGYRQYPDSETVEKAIYSNLKTNGLVNYGNKNFSLTDKGLHVAENIKKMIDGKPITSEGKLSRYAEEEIGRIIGLEGFQLFLKNEDSKITDNDFYNYLSVSAKTPKNDFIGRIKTLTDAMNELKSIDNITDTLRLKIPEYHHFMMNKFKDIIDFKSK